MITLKNRNIGISQGRVTAYTSISPNVSSRAAAAVTRRLETASAGGSTTLSAAGGANSANQDGYLTGLINDTGSLVVKAQRDMYTNDAICGSAVDLQSELPFSDFSLYGVDSNRLDAYQSAVAQLNIRSTAAQMTRHYLVDGMYASTLVFDPKNATFTDQIPYAAEHLTLDYVPLTSQDPIITAKVDAKYTEFLNAPGKQYERIRKLLPAKLLAALRSSEFTLDPLSTLFLARRMFFNQEPVSYLRRCLPVYLMEKTLFRGTLFETGRRQRSNVHVTAGDEYWDPTPDELSSIANIFQQTDLDPMGAIVVTRNSVNVNEFRQGGDFWKWTDAFDTFTTIKLKALGISDAFLSAESTYSNADNALVVFMENQNAYRDYFTHVVFTNKLFPLIAMVKGFVKKGAEKAEVDTSLGIKTVNDYSKLDIPKIRWQKRLTAGDDSNLFEALEKLTEKGIPVPYRLLIAAAGIDPETLVNELEDDADLKEKMDKLGKHLQQPGGGEDMMGGGGWPEGASVMAGMSPYARRIASMANVDWGNLGDAMTEDSVGKRHFAVNQRQAHRKINEQIARRAAALACENTYRRIRGDLARAGILKKPGTF
jgi:hypothetical protein